MNADQLQNALKPETDLEHYILNQPEVQKGMAWGVPRFGHPEGAIWKHVVEVLANVDKLADLDKATRRDLRLVAFIHDTFKNIEDKSTPRDWSRHHGILARKFVEPYIATKRTLDLIEWHDEAYYCWRMEALYNRPSKSRQRFDALLSKFEGNVDFYYRFFVCDTRTGDKNQAPLNWFIKEAEVRVETW